MGRPKEDIIDLKDRKEARKRSNDRVAVIDRGKITPNDENQVIILTSEEIEKLYEEVREDD